MRIHDHRVPTPTVFALAALLAALPGAAAAQFNCLPSCAADDGRFLVIAAGADFATLSDPILDLTFIVPAGTATFDLGIFDGDVLGTDTLGAFHWDNGVLPTNAIFEYTLFADPEANVSGTEAVLGPMTTLDESPPGVPVLGNNAWASFTVPTGPEAQSADGNFTYRLRIELLNPDDTVALNAFKVRTSEFAVIEPIAQPFGYIANITSLDDILIVFPSFPATTPTTYDGTFSFFVEADGPQTVFEVWGGDFDRGKFDGTDQDTDDPNTPGAPFEPVWATIDTVPEGVAMGLGTTTGNPNDDISPFAFFGNGIYFLRPPSVEFTVVTPDSQTFLNDNPSGNQEWELFSISTIPGDPDADYTTTTLPAGAYEIAIDGVDMGNLNFLLTPFRLLCADEDGEPCVPPPPPAFAVGDTVFEDLDGDGTDDGGTDPGIPGVVVRLVGSAGGVLDSTVTDGSGTYFFPVQPGTFTVEVADENFAAPPAAGSLGDRVWLDANGDGLEGPVASEPGLANVALHLYLDDGDLVADPSTDTFVRATRTDMNGEYRFSGLAPGTYFVDVVRFTVPPGLTLSGGTDPSALRTITAAETFLDLDFGYTGATALVGDFVWSDADGDGIQDPGEPGIGGVTLDLVDDTTGAVVATATTATDGSYRLTRVSQGDYTVDVTDTSGVLSGYSLTVGPESNPDPTAAFSVAQGDALLDKDFGYQNPALHSISDVVWLDTNADGLLNGAEGGIAGVTVSLLGPGGEVIATAVTDASGSFTFSGLPDGGYTLLITDHGLALDGLVTTTAPAAAGSLAVTLAGVDLSGINFGYDFGGVAAGAVGDRVWLDADGDGAQDLLGEPGLANVTVELYLDNGDAVPDVSVDTLVASAATDLAGNYIFGGLAAGTYFVQVDDATVPRGLVLSGGSDPSALRTITSTETFLDLDFGYTGLSARVGDFVWNDANGDGLQDPGEAALVDVTLDLLDSSGMVIAEARTTEGGFYLFSGLAPGSYTVAVTDTAALLTGYTLTSSLDGAPSATATVTLAAGETRLDADFGYRNMALYSISDVVWFDSNRNGIQDEVGTGIDGVTVNLRGPRGRTIATTTTSGGGLFSFPDLPDGLYTLTITDLDGVLDSLVATTAASARRSQAVVLAGADVSGIHFGWVDTGALEAFFGTVDDGDGDPDRHTDTVVDADVLDYDFGYALVCNLTVEKTCQVIPDPGPFSCSDAKPLDVVSMIWNGTQTVDVKAWKGNVGSTLLATVSGVAPGTEVSVPGYAGSPNDVVWEVFAAGGGKIGESKFHLSCSDSAMNGAEDCGTLQGNGKSNESGLINDWLLDGLAGNGQVLDCTPTPPAPAEACEFTGRTVSCDTVGNPDTLTWKYTGGGCAATDNQQAPGKHVCTETTPGIDGSSPMTITDKSGNTATLSPGDEVTFTRSDSEELTLTQGAAEEFNLIHVSCSQPLVALDVYGSLTLVALDGQRAGSAVTYTYTVSNGGADLDGVTLFDDQLGPVGGPVFLAFGETAVFSVTADVAVTTVNRVDVEGEALVNGDVCTAEDTAVVTVTEPCDVCDGGTTDLTFQYLGAASAQVVIYDKDSADPSKVLFQGAVDPGEEISITKRPGQSKLASNISLWVDGALDAVLHTSCSQPIGPGQNVGEFQIVEGRSKDNGLMCPLDVCNVDASAGLDFDGKEVRWDLTNLGDLDAVIERIVVSWPAANGDLIEVKRDGDVIHKGDFAPPSAVIDSGWEGDPGKRTIEFGKTDTLKLKFQNDVILGDYSVTVDFDQGCSVTTSFAGPFAGAAFACDKPIDSLTMIWDGAGTVSVKAWKGNVGSTSLGTRTGVAPGTEVTFSGFAGSPNDVFWEIFNASGSKIGESKFHLSCSDADMNGPEDCGKRQGDAKGSSGFLNDWILEGMIDAVTALDCTAPAFAVRDAFTTESFGNDDGPDSWETDWLEDDPESGGTGPGAGQVRVLAGELRLDDYPDTGGQPSAAREVDLSGFTAATLSFDFRTSSDVDANDAIAVEASSNGGASWTLLDTITGIAGASSGSKAYDVSGSISADTRIRFRVFNLYGGRNEYFFADNVQIVAE